MVPVQTDEPVTVMVVEAEAFAGVGLVSFSVTLAVFVIEPVAVAAAVRETEAVAPLPSVPKLQVTVDVLARKVQVPWLAVAETKVRPTGSTSDTTTPVEFDGPLLVTVMVKVTFVPRVTVVGTAVLVMARLAAVRGTEPSITVTLSLVLPLVASMKKALAGETR